VTRRILLVNPNTSPGVTDLLAAEARRVAGQSAEIEAVTAPFGSASLECRAELVVAAHAVLQAIASRDDCDAAVIGAFGDPGLTAAREIARGPVFGLGQSGLRAAAAKGRRFAIVTVGERLRLDIEAMVAARGLSGQLTTIRFLGGSVLDVAERRAGFLEAITAAANACAEENGAQGVLLGGAPFAGVPRELAGRVAVPLFDGLTSAIEEAMRAPPGARADGPSSDAGLRKAMPGVAGPLAERIDEFLRRG
jgi:Asp/Glu/hydantoin racemase